jgi:D-alanyl-D-alanine carboxypeptidase
MEAGDVGKALKAYEGVATGAVVLVRVGEQTRVLTSGLANVKQQRPMRPSDRFPIMSITKTMVATAVLQLVAAGKLGLDDNVEDVLPGLLPQGRRITIRNLLSHRSGLNGPPEADLPPPARWTKDSWIDAAAAHPLEFAPGSSGHYSNVGYEVLGRVVEQITGKPLRAALRQKVFGPAGMSDTTLLGSATVQGYFDSKAVDDVYFPFFPAAGGVVSTVADVDRFYRALWDGKFLDPELVRTMSKSLGVVSPWGMDYGLGVWFDRESCGIALGHSGAGPGFSTKAWTLEGTERSVVVMVNDGDGGSIADYFATTGLCGRPS